LTEGLAARRAALDVLEAVARGARFDAARDRHFTRLPDADRRLAHEIAAGVLRSRSALDARLAPLASHRWDRIEARLQDILRIGAYQLVSLDRVPPHAVVSTAVALARDTLGPGAARLVNAVLRRLATIDRAAIAAPDSHRTRPGYRLARDHSHPEWLVDRWVRRFGPEETAALLRWNDERPPLVLQPINEPVEALSERLQGSGIASALAPFGAGVIVPRTPPSQLPGYEEGTWIVQDPAQALVLAFAAIPEHCVVYDACAAPGGKAVRLASGRRVVAGDRTRARVARLRDTVQRTRAPVSLLLADATRPPITRVDAVLVDAPCTATGTLRRHPDARWRLTPRDLGRLGRAQATLLAATASVVRVGGILVYVTCSLEPEENSEQVERFLRRHPEYRRIPSPGAVPAGAVTAEGDLELLPQRHGIDGAYAARLERIA